MPYSKSHRVSQRRRERKMPLRTKAKTLVAKARTAISSGSIGEAEENAKAAIVALDKAAQKGALHRANVARRKSRLMKQVSASKAKTQPA